METKNPVQWTERKSNLIPMNSSGTMQISKNLRELSSKEISELTPEMIMGRPELKKANYTEREREAIELLLLQLGLCRKEKITGFIDIWINEFASLNIRAYEVMQRIRLAKIEKKYGEIDFSVFMNVNIKEYSKYFNYGEDND